jgi:GAF domain-containing protein
MAVQPTERERRLAATFVTLADTFTSGSDLLTLFDELAGACLELLDGTAAGLVLADADGRLRVAASSNQQVRVVELLEIQRDAGPCLDSYRRCERVVVDDIAATADRWPAFAAAAERRGFRAACSLPMRLHDKAIGALNVFHEQPHSLSDEAVGLAQALADVATIAMEQHRALQRTSDLADHLQQALNSRLIIEQAKGVVAEHQKLEMQQAFELLRGHARRTSRKLSDVAAAVVSGTLTADALRPAAAPH